MNLNNNPDKAQEEFIEREEKRRSERLSFYEERLQEFIQSIDGQKFLQFINQIGLNEALKTHNISKARGLRIEEGSLIVTTDQGEYTIEGRDFVNHILKIEGKINDIQIQGDTFKLLLNIDGVHWRAQMYQDLNKKMGEFIWDLFDATKNINDEFRQGKYGEMMLPLERNEGYPLI